LKTSAIAMALTSLTAIVSGCGSAPLPPAVNVAAMIPTGPVTGIGGAGQCVPLTQPIGFQATNLSIDTTQAVYAGNVPYGDPLTMPGQYGQVIQSVGGAIGALPGSQLVQLNPAGVHPDGKFVMNLVSNVPAIGGSGYGSATGVITISPEKLKVIYGMFGLSYPNTASPYMGGTGVGISLNGPGMTNQQIPCVSGIGISLSVASLVGNYVNGGRVYLYLNGQQQIANLVY